MIQEHIVGRITKWNEDGTVVIAASVPNLNHALDRKYSDVEVIFGDGRRISPEQRRKCYALIGEVAEYVDGVRSAETIEEQKNFFKMEFMLKRMESAERKLFSLSNCDMTTAREFITYLIDFIIANDIPTRVPLLEQAEDIQKYVYACLMNKKCCICGKKADLHHVDRVGMGRNRDEINHLGMRCLPLCREHHTRLHEIGDELFVKEYHLEPIRIDKKIARLYRLNTKEKKHES